LRHPVEGVVHLDGAEGLRVELQHVLRRDLLGIEVSLPFLVRPAAGAGPDLHRVSLGRPSAHRSTVVTSSSSTSFAVRPSRFSTANEWSPPSITCNVARS